MTDKTPKPTLTRRNVLAGLGTIGVASAGAGLGTTALFSDIERFANNTLTAGELDLFVDYTFAYDQGIAGSASTSGTVDGNVDGETGEAVSIVLEDVKPGDSGRNQFCFRIVDNPAYIWACGGITADLENGQPEPELNHPGGDDDGEDGELDEAIQATLTYCDESGAVIGEVATGTLGELLELLGEGVPLDGTGSVAIAGNQACYDGTSHSSGTEGVVNPCLCLDWAVPESVGNEIQTDSLTFDLEFHAVQCRHSDGTDNPCTETVDVECEACETDFDSVSQSPELSALTTDVGSFPGVSLFTTIDTPDGTAGTIPPADFSVCADGCERDVSVEFTSEGKPVDITFLFDVSSSMGEEIDGMKANVQNFVDDVELEGIDAQYALFAYSDDDSSSGGGDATDGSVLLQGLTGDATTFQTAVSGLTLSGHGVGFGDDYPEDAFTAIAEADSVLSWRPGAQRVLVVITDAPSESEDTAPVDPERADVDAILTTGGYTLIAVSPDTLSSGYTGTDLDMRDVAQDNGGSWIDIDGGDFSAILDEITDVVATSWRVQYTSPNPATDGSLREVLLTVVDPTEGTLYGKTTYVAPT
jgi:predicted ribosomally synthesized peptide with SipW-like signal peptide